MFNQHRRRVPLFVRDVKKGRLDFFDSMGEAAKFVGISQSLLSYYTSGAAKKLCKGRYIFAKDYIGSIPTAH